jgi:hypothetical protein
LGSLFFGETAAHPCRVKLQTLHTMDTANRHVSVQAIYAGMAAIDFAALTQLLGRDGLTFWLHLAVCCFAISIPGLILFSIMRHETANKNHTCWDFFLFSFWLISLLSSFLGVGSLFAHFHQAYGIVFAVCAVAAVAGMFHLSNRNRNK